VPKKLNEFIQPAWTSLKLKSFMMAGSKVGRMMRSMEFINIASVVMTSIAHERGWARGSQLDLFVIFCCGVESFSAAFSCSFKLSLIINPFPTDGYKPRHKKHPAAQHANVRSILATLVASFVNLKGCGLPYKNCKAVI
jgi:hypothetical protein